MVGMATGSDGLPRDLASRFRVVGTLGEGSFGKVLEVAPLARGPHLALKLVPVGDDPARVERELRASMIVTHDAVLRPHQVGVEAGLAWLLMDRADGSLAPHLEAAAGLADPAQAAVVWEHLRQVARGLAALADRDLVHRDLKPENVLLFAGRPRIADLGLAKGGSLETLTATGMLVGTPAFMSPEQARGERLTPASDLYSLGVMFHILLEGTPPGTGGSPLDRIRSRAAATLPGLASARRHLPTATVDAVASLLAPRPEDRPADARAFANSLGPFAREPPPHPAPGSTSLLERASQLGSTGARTSRLPAPLAPSATTLGSPPGSDSRPTRGVGTGRGLAAGLVLGLVLAVGAALRPRPGPPLPAFPQESSSALPTEPETNLTSGIESLLEDLRDRSATGELSTDPGMWGEAFAAMGPLRQRLAALVDHRISADERPALLRLDAALAGLELPPMARPFLETAPLPAAPVRLLLAEAAPLGGAGLEARRYLHQPPLGLPDPIEGWAATAFSLAVRLDARARVLAARYMWRFPERRPALEAWHQASDLLRQLLRALDRCLVLEPAHQERIAAWIWDLSVVIEPLTFGSAFDVDPRLVTAPPRTPAHAYAAARLFAIHREIRQAAAESLQGDETVRDDLLEAALGDPREPLPADGWSRGGSSLRYLSQNLLARDLPGDVYRILGLHLDRVLAVTSWTLLSDLQDLWSGLADRPADRPVEAAMRARLASSLRRQAATAPARYRDPWWPALEGFLSMLDEP